MLATTAALATEATMPNSSRILLRIFLAAGAAALRSQRIFPGPPCGPAHNNQVRLDRLPMPWLPSAEETDHCVCLFHPCRPAGLIGEIIYLTLTIGQDLKDSLTFLAGASGADSAAPPG